MDHRLRIGPALLGRSVENVQDALDTLRPRIKLHASLGPNACSAAVSLSSMLMRVFPHTTIEGDGQLRQNRPWPAESVQQALQSFSSSRPKPTRNPERDLIIGVGPVDGGELYIGGDGWTARIASRPTALCDDAPGLGLQAAASLAAAEVMKRALGPLGLPHYPLGQEDLIWNLVDYRREAFAGGPLFQQQQRVHVALLGAGSVGSSAAALLAGVDGLTGTAVVIDGDDFDPQRNPYRYPAAQNGVAGPKASWIAGMLNAAGWTASAFPKTARHWVAASGTPGFDGIAISSVDTVEGRLEVADVLARMTLSVGVAGLALHIQREHLGDGLRCPYCEFADLGPSLTQAEVWSQQSGLTVQRIAELLVAEDVAGARLTAQDVDVAAAAGKIRRENASLFVGRRLADLVRQAYAEATITPQAGSEGDVAVGAPHVSWMGGLLAAAEVTKAAFGLPLVDRRVDLDLSGLPPGFQIRHEARTDGRCVCTSPARIRWMQRLYGERGLYNGADAVAVPGGPPVT